DAWLADTRHLTYCERGAYFDLLVLMWRSPECSVPDDMLWLTRHLNVPSAVLLPIIEEFCMRSHNGRIYQKRLQREFRYILKKRQQTTSAANARWAKKKGDADAMREKISRMPFAYAPTPTPQRKKDSPAKPNGFAEEFDRFWTAYPRKIGKQAAIHAW